MLGIFLCRIDEGARVGCPLSGTAFRLRKLCKPQNAEGMPRYRCLGGWGSGYALLCSVPGKRPECAMT